MATTGISKQDEKRRTNEALAMDLSSLPDDPKLLKDRLREVQGSLRVLVSEIELLQQRLNRQLAYRFGRHSERFTDHPGQGFLFPDIDGKTPSTDAKPSDPAVDEEDESRLPPSSNRRKKGKNGRRKLPANLPVEEILLPIAEEDRICSCCNAPRIEMGRESSDELEYKPASLFIRRTVRPKYACPKCQSGILTAEPPVKPVERGLAGPGLLAHVAVSKYADHLPLFRQEAIFERQGVSMARSTLCDWIAAVAHVVEPIVKFMTTEIKLGKKLNSDDTLVSVSDPSRKTMRKSPLWVYVGDDEHPYTVFDFTESRSRDGPERFLADFTGYLQVDAFSGYNRLLSTGRIKEVACMAHVRRKFFDAKEDDKARAGKALSLIRRLYQVERDVHDLSHDERKTLRSERSAPLLSEFHAWLKTQKHEVLPKSSIGGAIHYALNQWEALLRYLEDGRLTIDNNAAERELRSVAIGRKNWLFAGSDAGGRRAAVLFSIMATCKRHGVDPFAYLRAVLSLPPRKRGDALAQLTPLRWKQQLAESTQDNPV